MKRFINVALLLILVTFTWLALPATVHAQETGNGQIIFGGVYHLYDGETLENGLVIFGGQGILDEGSVVKGDIFIAGGTLEVAGTVEGNIIASGGTVILANTAVVKGNIDLIGAGFRNDDGTVEGEISQNDSLNFNFLNVPAEMIPHLAPLSIPDVFQSVLKPIGDFLWGVLSILATAALAAMVVLLLPKHTERLAKSITLQPVLSGGMGALTLLVAPPLLLLLVITIILIPVGLLGIMLLALASLFGWVAIGYEIGQRMSVLFKQNWAPVVCGGLGTLVLNVMARILVIIPCIGWLLPAVVLVIGLGGVFISRFGTRIYETGNSIHSATLTSFSSPESITVHQESPQGSTSNPES